MWKPSVVCNDDTTLGPTGIAAIVAVWLIVTSWVRDLQGDLSLRLPVCCIPQAAAQRAAELETHRKEHIRAVLTGSNFLHGQLWFLLGVSVCFCERTWRVL